MSDYIRRLHEAVQYYRAQGMWGMAEAFEKLLIQAIQERS